MTITDTPSAIEVIKTATPTEVAEPGGLVTFAVAVDNTIAVDAVNHHQPDRRRSTAISTARATARCRRRIAAGGSYTCSFTANVTGNAGYVEIDVVTASGTDDDGNPVSDDDDATVTITDTPSAINVIKDCDPQLDRRAGWPRDLRRRGPEHLAPSTRSTSPA